MGAMGGGAKGKGDDDKEHKSADYLQGDHLDEWIREEGGQKVAPPVLGAYDYEQRDK